MRYHLTPVGMVIIKKSIHNKCWRCGEKRTLLYCWWEYKLVQSLWKTVWSICSSHVHSSSINNSQDKETVYVSIYRGMKKENVKWSCIYVYLLVCLSLSLQWDITQSQKRRKSFHLQQHGWTLTALG